MVENKKQEVVLWQFVGLCCVGIVIAYFVGRRAALHLDAIASPRDVAAATTCAKQLLSGDLESKGKPITNYAITWAEKRCKELADERAGRQAESKAVEAQLAALEKNER